MTRGIVIVVCLGQEHHIDDLFRNKLLMSKKGEIYAENSQQSVTNSKASGTGQVPKVEYRQVPMLFCWSMGRYQSFFAGIRSIP